VLITDTHGLDEINEAVPLAFARALLVKAQSQGLEVEFLLERARFPFNPLLPQQSSVFVSIEQYSRLCTALFHALGDESGGTMLGSITPVGTSRLLLYSIARCKNLRIAMQRAIEFNACCREQQGDVPRNELLVDSRSRLATLSYCATPDLRRPAPQEGTLCGLSMWLRLCGWLSGQHIDVVSATCAGPAPVSTVAVRHFFHCPVDFNEECNSVTFSARYLEADLIRSESDIDAFLRVAPYHVFIKPITSDASITTQIRELLGSDFRGVLPNFEELTVRLGMSARTLRRRLEREGTSFQRIKDNARRDAAISMLSRERMTVSAVAEHVGFSDPSAFHRSFKKWTGQSPGAYG
jgi:AraC-like DNA-binding protein